MDSISLLTADHNRVRGLFARFKEAEQAEDATTMASLAEQIATELDKELQELRANPEGEARELVDALTARGLPAELARQVADVLKENPEQALRVHAQEELGVVPDELPSPWTAALSSFVCFAVGAVIPLLTYLLGYPSVRNYDGSWTEWGNSVGVPIER